MPFLFKAQFQAIQQDNEWCMQLSVTGLAQNQDIDATQAHLLFLYNNAEKAGLW